MGDTFFGLHLGISNLAELAQARGLAEAIVKKHPDVQPEVEALLKLIVQVSMSRLPKTD